MKPEELAGNHKHFESFCWLDEPKDSELWGLFTILTRDSDLVEQSNAEAIKAEFDEEFPESNNYFIGSFGHWACGWVEHLCIKVYTDNTKTETTPEFKLLQQLVEKLSHYPLLDDEDHSKREFEATLENLESELHYAVNKLEEEWEDDNQDNDKPIPAIPSSKKIYNWLWNNDQRSLDNNDGNGGYPSSDSIKSAIETIWAENEKQRLIDIENKSGQLKLF